jgi:hypothetical protein
MGVILMKVRKDMIFAVLTTFCMCALMFTVIPIRSGLPYDPWADYNADDKIDIKDVSSVARLFGTLNTDNLTRNVNVTNWPSQLLPNYVNDSGFFILGALGTNDSSRERVLSIAGYRQVSICIGFNVNLDIWMTIYVSMGWSQIHEGEVWWETYGNRTEVKGEHNTLWFFTQTIDVRGPELTITIYNMEDYPIDNMRILVYATC